MPSRRANRLCTVQVTITYIDEGIKKLRAVGAKEGGLAKQDFWRGMRSLSMSATQSTFLQVGGSVIASLSNRPDPV